MRGHGRGAPLMAQANCLKGCCWGSFSVPTEAINSGLIFLAVIAFFSTRSGLSPYGLYLSGLNTKGCS